MITSVFVYHHTVDNNPEFEQTDAEVEFEY